MPASCIRATASFGIALLDPGARVVARLLGAGRVDLEAGWVGKCLAGAEQVRHWLDLGDSTAWRLVNGEGD